MRGGEEQGRVKPESNRLMYGRRLLLVAEVNIITPERPINLAPQYIHAHAVSAAAEQHEAVAASSDACSHTDKILIVVTPLFLRQSPTSMQFDIVQDHIRN